MLSFQWCVPANSNSILLANSLLSKIDQETGFDACLPAYLKGQLAFSRFPERGLVNLPSDASSLRRPPPINFSHDLFSPPDRIGDGADGRGNPSPAVVLRQL